MTTNDGLAIFLHEASKIPVLSVPTAHVMPNTETDIGIRETNLTRQPYPYVTDCSADWSSSQ